MPGLTLPSVAAALLLAATPPDPAPRRVASLNLTADEILVEILPQERLVAVTAFADEKGASNVTGRVPPSVARFRRADLERIVALHPDLVVVSRYSDADFLALLAKSGLRYHQMEGLESLAGIREAILRLGAAVGEPAAAAVLVERYDARFAQLSARLEGVKRKRVLYWSHPFTAGRGTPVAAIIEAAGGVSVGSELVIGGTAPPGAERVFVSDPDVLLVGGGGTALSSLKTHPLLSQLRALREGSVIEMPTELVQTLSHHVADACWYLASKLYPDRFEKDRP